MREIPKSYTNKNQRIITSIIITNESDNSEKNK